MQVLRKTYVFILMSLTVIALVIINLIYKSFHDLYILL